MTEPSPLNSITESVVAEMRRAALTYEREIARAKEDCARRIDVATKAYEEALVATAAKHTLAATGGEFTSRRSRGITHGEAGYQRGCRCGICRDAKAAKQRERRARLKGTLPPDDPRHGTINGHTNFGCNCRACLDASNTYQQATRDKEADAARQRERRARLQESA